MAKKYTVEFTRNAVYQEKGYIIIEASTKAEARQLAKEALENGEDAMDYEGDVSDIEFVSDQFLDDNHTHIDSIEIDDFIEDDNEEGEEEYSDYDCEEDEEY